MFFFDKGQQLQNLRHTRHKADSFLLFESKATFLALNLRNIHPNLKSKV